MLTIISPVYKNIRDHLKKYYYGSILKTYEKEKYIIYIIDWLCP